MEMSQEQIKSISSTLAKFKSDILTFIDMNNLEYLKYLKEEERKEKTKTYFWNFCYFFKS